MANNSIFFVIPGNINSLSGGYAYNRRLIAELGQLSIDVEILQLSGRFPQPTKEDLTDIDKQFSALPNDSIVLVDGLAFGVMGDIAERHNHRLNIIALCHHPLALETGLSPEKQTFYHTTEKRALNAATAILVTSGATAITLQNSFHIDASKIYIAPPGTDTQHYAQCKGDPPILLTVASLTFRKGHDILIDALAKIPHIPWQAHFVGSMEFDPEWATYLQQKVINYGFTKRILFLGGIADTKHEYQQADLFVLPSHYEGYGMAFAEALAFGLPIVATQVDSISSLVPKAAGVLVPPNNSHELATTLNHLLSDPIKRKRLQAGAQHAASTLPSWRDCAQIVAELIKIVKNANMTNQ